MREMKQCMVGLMRSRGSAALHGLTTQNRIIHSRHSLLRPEIRQDMGEIETWTPVPRFPRSVYSTTSSNFGSTTLVKHSWMTRAITPFGNACLEFVTDWWCDVLTNGWWLFHVRSVFWRTVWKEGEQLVTYSNKQINLAGALIIV